MPKPPELDDTAKKETPQRSAWHLNQGRIGSKSRSGSKSAPDPSEGSEPAPENGCLAWLLAWEARQERMLRVHEEAMRLQVDALRREMLITMAHPPHPHLKRLNSCASSVLFPVADSKRCSSEFSADMESPRGSILGGHQSVSVASIAKKRLSNEKPGCAMRAAAFTLVHSSGFSVATSAMIFLYTIAVGVMAELEMSSAMEGKQEPWWLWHVDSGFAASFLLEVFLRLLSDGRHYFDGSERNWNIFDSCVAAVGIADVGLGMHINLGFLRILRACRVVRVLRVLRSFSNLRDLRLMVESLCACVPCLGWGLVLLGFLNYIFSVVLLRGTHQFVREGSLSEASHKVVRESFCGMYGSLHSLTQAISGGRSWGEYLAPFEEVNPIFGLLFPAFMLFVIFGALNILTGIFVESTSSIAKQNKELAVEEEIATEKRAEAQIREFFEELDTDCSGTLSQEELAAALQDPRVKAYFAVLQINAEDARSLFKLLDEQRTGAIAIENFIEKCQTLRGGARAMDVATMLKENGKMHRQFQTLLKSVEEVSMKVQKKASGNGRVRAVKTKNMSWLSEADGGEQRAASKKSAAAAEP